jgi:tetratricopeptide (TPR) repeat protein
MEGRLQLMASDQTKSRMDTISQSKEAGNNSFSSGDFKNATVSYSEAIQAYCQFIGQDIDPISQKYTKTTLTSIASAIISIASPITPTRDKILASSSGTSPSQSLEDLQALARQVKPHILYSNRSASLGHLGQYEEALADSLKCIEAKPDWPKGYYRKGEALIGLLRFDEALPALYRALERVLFHYI